MTEQYLGEVAALLTAACWTVTAMAFESAGKRVGALSLNLIRLVIGLVFLSIYNAIFNDGLFPVATDYQWFWLVISGLVGFVLGDLFLFRAFILIGARISMLIMALVPPITALIGWITLGEVLSGMEFLGMVITISGIVLVMATRINNRMKPTGLSVRMGPMVLGVLLALGGAVGQAAGLVLSKKGMQDMDAFAATQIRIMAGVVGFLIVITLFRRWKNVYGAVQHTDTGIAATLMALTPVMIIPAAIILKKEKIKLLEIIGALISVGGVALFFL
ncbi:MAG: DMT family transporter [Bacteroidales bacterium]|nr:DMT family transporter [Bacteroidales bacterium]